MPVDSILSRVSTRLFLLAICLASASPGSAAPASDAAANRLDELEPTILVTQKSILELQQQLIPLLRVPRPDDEESRQKIAKLEAEIAAQTDHLAQLKKLARDASAPQDQQQQLAELQMQIAKRDTQLAKLAKRYEDMLKHMAERDDAKKLPPMEETEFKVFRLKNVQAQQAAQTVDSLFGASMVRVAIDERTNSMIVAGKAEALSVIEALLVKLDQQAQAATETSANGADSTLPRSLLLRVYWLADGLPPEEGQDPDRFLPKAVLEAVDRLGLEAPRIVAQTVNSLSRDSNASREVSFKSHVPALIFKQPVQLSCSGKVQPVRDGSAELEVQVSVSGNMVNTDLSGSLATPLGHFMVLGTANSVSAEGGAFIPGMAGGEMGMGMEGGGYGGRGGYAVPGGFAPPQDPAAAVDQTAEPRYNTSHFAFVVQVNEAESFAAE